MWHLSKRKALPVPSVPLPIRCFCGSLLEPVFWNQTIIGKVLIQEPEFPRSEDRRISVRFTIAQKYGTTAED